jgi:hypothetical protein
MRCIVDYLVKPSLKIVFKSNKKAVSLKKYSIKKIKPKKGTSMNEFYVNVIAG